MVWRGLICTVVLFVPACEAGASPSVVRVEPARAAAVPADPVRVRPPPAPKKPSVDTEPLGCLLAGRSARIHMQFGTNGCFGGSDSLLDVSVAEQSTVRGRLWHDHHNHLIVDQTGLTRETGMAIVQSLVNAAQRAEIDEGLGSTTSVFARIFYWCDGYKQGPMTLSASDSAAELRALSTPIVELASPHYMRAEGLVAVAEAELQAWPSTVQPDSEMRRAREHKLWRPHGGVDRITPQPKIEVWGDVP